MTKTHIYDLGSSICVDDQDEKLVPALGVGGAGIPGDLCGITRTDGKIFGSDIDAGAGEFFVGILMESKITGTEAIIGVGIPCKLVVPKSGHGYRIRCVSVAETAKVGSGLTFSTTEYKAERTVGASTALIKAFIGQIALEVLTGDTVCEMTWK